MIKKILVIGSKGMAGHMIKEYLSQKGYDVYGAFREKEEKNLEANEFYLDAFDKEKLEEILKKVKPDFVINCIGILNQFAENNPDIAIYVNGYFPHYLDRLSEKYGYKLIHITTDYVFSGKKGNYTEDDFRDADSYYGRSKAIGEVNNNRTLTFRTSIIGPDINKDGIGLFNWFMKQEGRIKGYSNVFWSGVTTLELAKAIEVNLPKSVQQILYFHQALSLIDLKWNILKKEERLFWIYKNIYPFFIKMYLDRIKKIIVQTEWVKKEFSQKFNYNLKNIIVVKPSINLPDTSKIKMISKEKFRIFYPATPLVYKNHEIIIKALGELKKEKKDLANDLECIFTFSEKENERIDRLIKKYDVEDIIKLVGKIPYERVLEYYKSSDLMIFPSKLETLGLPLMEAKHFNLNILVIDLPYSRETIGNYRKSCYVKIENEWKIKILIHINKKS